MANNSELLQSLLGQAEQLPLRDDDALHALRIRSEMVIRRIFGDSSFYLNELNQIGFRPSYFPAGETSTNAVWRSGQQSIINLVNTMLEDVGEFEPITPRGVRSKVFIAHDGESPSRDRLELECWQMNLEPVIVEDMVSRDESVDDKVDRGLGVCPTILEERRHQG